MSVSTAVFYLIALITVGFCRDGGVFHATSSIPRSRYSGRFMGVAGIYVFLGADFVAAVQVLDLRRRHFGFDSVCRHADAPHHRCRRSPTAPPGEFPALIIIGVARLSVDRDRSRVRRGLKPRKLVYAADHGEDRRPVFVQLPACPSSSLRWSCLRRMIGAVVLSRKEIKE